ncbi:hypothetical protein [Serratia marcescens]|uniref:hypothetical protein n=1 Tax=Serratia marcescens TaxID=615 RepID=UPI001BD54DC7|nr:hypothetical protein [Serratia marcescens]
MKWKLVAKCPHCDFIKSAPFGVFLENAQPSINRKCPSCDEHVTWEEATGAWISDSVWWNPVTWRRGHWKLKE